MSKQRNQTFFLITDFCTADLAAFLKWKRELNGKLTSIH